MHALLEIDGIKNLHPVMIPVKSITNFINQAALRSSIFWIEKGYIADNF